MATEQLTETGRVGNWFQTYSGIAFHLLDPRPEEICIEDIAHHLSLQCRYNGAIREFYSVGQHSVLCGRYLRAQTRNIEGGRWGLLHDAAEAYVGDMVRPLKMAMPTFKAAELRIMEQVAVRFGLPWPEPEYVARVDARMLMTEMRDLMAVPPQPWDCTAKPLNSKIEGWPPAYAEEAFLELYHELWPDPSKAFRGQLGQ